MCVCVAVCVFVWRVTKSVVLGLGCELCNLQVCRFSIRIRRLCLSLYMLNISDGVPATRIKHCATGSDLVPMCACCGRPTIKCKFDEQEFMSGSGFQCQWLW